jgi:hypothetical protein
MKYFLIILAYLLPLEIFAEPPSTGINPKGSGWSGGGGNGW